MSELRYDVDQRVLTLTIDREEQRNTVTYGVLDALIDAFATADADPDIRAVIVTSAGEEWFSAGTDLRAGGGGMDADTTGFKPLRGGIRDIGGELALRIFNSNKPVIAAVNGTAVGIGITMILPMDIRIASAEARFGLPFARRGIVPESASTWFLPRVVGIARAIDWAVTGRIFSSDEALASGLVREVVDPGDVLPRAREVARDIAEQTSAVSVALIRQMLWRNLGADHPMAANRLESQALLAVVPSADAREGVAAFKAKRPAHFPLQVPSDLPDFYPWWHDEPFA